MNLLNENISHNDLKNYIKELYNYIAKELNIDVPPRVFLRRDKANAEDILGKTGGYDPEAQEIHLYITDRHPKDVLRSFAHELVHHMQKLQGLTDKVNIDLIHRDEAYAQNDEGLREMERQAFEEGNMLFRAWTDGKKMERKNIMNESKGAKPDFLDLDKDGNKKEPMKKAAKDKAPFKGGKTVKTPSGKHKAKKLALKGRKEAEAQAKDDMNARQGKDKKMDEQEYVEALQENKEENNHPYPQLLEQKPRLMQEAFNKKEELVYQELIRRFLKK